MNRFLQQVYLDNTVGDYLLVTGIILFVLFINRYISRYVASLLCRLMKRKWKSFDDQVFINLVFRPLGIFLVVSVSIVALYRLNFPRVLNVIIYKYSLQRIFITIGIIIQIACFIWLLLRTIDFIATVLEKRASITAAQNDNQLIVFFRDFLKVVIGIIGGMLILHFAFSYNIGTLLTGLSIVGAAVALALKESLENLIASFVIFFDKPFAMGDFVKVSNVMGSVERIGLRSTRIRTVDKSYVTVPNKQMVDSVLDNISLRSQIRGELTLHVNLLTPPAKIEVLINEVKGHLSNVPEVQTYNALFNDIKVQSFTVFVEFFTSPIEWARFLAIKQELNFFILQTMDKLEIRIAAEGKEIAIVP